MVPQKIFGRSYLFVSDPYIYIYKYIQSPFYFRFVSRHNTNHRANGEATPHSNQAFGAFWSRVTPPELLYIWLLSFDELRLAMNAHLPVVRPLLCYARRGATPMHQKKKGFSQALFSENRILVQRKYLSYHLCHFVPFFGQPKTKKTIKRMNKSYEFSGK